MRSTRITSARPLVVMLASVAALLSGLAAVLLLRALPEQARPHPAPQPACNRSSPCLALVIDDVGRDLAALDRLLRLDGDLTFAVLPHAAHTRESVAAIQRRQREVLLHLPVIPLDPSHISDEQVVVGRHGALGESVAECVARVPEAVGFNNHMGSALSGDREAMTRILRAIPRGWIVLDSRTAQHSEICAVARLVGRPCVERDVFLDHSGASSKVASAWEAAVGAARARGWAVAIGHPLPATLEALPRLLGQAQVRIVRLSRLVSAPDAT